MFGSEMNKPLSALEHRSGDDVTYDRNGRVDILAAIQDLDFNPLIFRLAEGIRRAYEEDKLSEGRSKIQM
jgi:hypothetical protein